VRETYDRRLQNGEEETMSTWTVTYFGSRKSPKELSEEEVASVQEAPRYAYVRAADASEAIEILYQRLQFDRDRQERMLEPQRKAWRAKRKGQPYTLHLAYTAIHPFAKDAWKAAPGRQPVNGAVLDLTRE